MCIAVSCKIHQTRSLQRHVKHKVYSGNWGIDRYAVSRLACFKLGAPELIRESVGVYLISNITVIAAPSELALGDSPRQAVGTMDSYRLVVSGVNPR